MSVRSIEEAFVRSDLEQFGELFLEENQFAIDLVHRSRVILIRVVRVVADLLKSLERLPWIRLRFRRGLRIRRGFGLRLGFWGGRVSLWTVSFSCSKFVANTPLVVITS